MANRKFLNTLKRIGKAAFTIVLVYLVFQKIDLEMVGRTVRPQKPGRRSITFTKNLYKK